MSWAVEHVEKRRGWGETGEVAAPHLVYVIPRTGRSTGDGSVAG